MKNICKIVILLIAVLHVVTIFVPVNALPLLFFSALILFLFGFPLQGKGFTVILGKVLTTLSLPIPAVSIALILLLSSSISFIASPFAGMVLMTAKFLNVKPMEVAVTWNAGYCVLFLAEGILFACLWG